MHVRLSAGFKDTTLRVIIDLFYSAKRQRSSVPHACASNVTNKCRWTTKRHLENAGGIYKKIKFSTALYNVLWKNDNRCIDNQSYVKPTFYGYGSQQ